MLLKQTNFKNIKAIVFDLDDTLYPQAAYKRSGFKVVSEWVATHCNIDQSTVLLELEAILKQYGGSYPYMFDQLVERLSLKQALVPEMVRVFIEHDPKIQCYDGVIQMLARLRKQYLLGILTDGRLSVQKNKIDALRLESQVDKILCSDSLCLEKPATQLYEWFENTFQVDGKRLMYVGDNPAKDFYGANRRGWSTIHVMTGMVHNDKLPKQFEALHCIPSIKEFEQIFKF